MKAVGTLWKKEMVDALRDRRTLVMMLLVPLLLYPVTLLLMGAVVAAGKERLARQELVVALCGDEAARLLEGRAAPAHTSFRRMELAAAEGALREQEIGAAIQADPGAAQALAEGRQAAVTVAYTKRHDSSIEAKDRMKQLLEQLGAKVASVRLEEKGLPAAFAEPLRLSERDIDFQEDYGPLIASRMLPIIMVVMLFLGSFYAAIGVTAGEKERGTLETLLVAPVRPMEVMAGKYLAVSGLATTVTIINLVAMSATFRLGLDMGEGIHATLRLSAGQVAALLLALVPAAFLVSAVSLAVASLARTYREGQTLLTPLMMVGMMPGVIAQMPGIELNAYTAAVPLLNVALVVRSVVLGNVQAAEVAITLLSVCLCCAGGIFLAANAFKSEALRFGGAEGWRELFRFGR